MTIDAPVKLLSLVLTFAVALLAAAPAGALGTLYYDVTDAAAFPGFTPAKCDGSSDDTGAFQAAINQAALTQATIEVPPNRTCVIAGGLNFQNTRGVCLIGGSGAPSIPFSFRPHLVFTSASGNPLITFGGTVGLCLANLYLEAANPGFSGTFIEGGGGAIAALATFENLLILGSSQSAGPACLISLDRTYAAVIDNVWLQQAQVDVCGAGASFSNYNIIRNSSLIASVALIKNASDGWVVGPNNHLNISAPPLNISAPALSIPGNISCNNINVTGNYINNAGVGAIDVISISNPDCSITVRGNYIGASPQSTAIKMTGGRLIADGNVFSGLIPFNLGSADASQIGINEYLSGSSPEASPLPAAVGRHIGLQTTTMFGAAAYCLQCGASFAPFQTSGNLTVNGAATVNGNVVVHGRVAKSNSTFRIDHPLDPAHKYLVHSTVESPDMKNVYDGIITLDANGEAEVRMPDYFEALNRDFRYQLTCVGEHAPVYVSREMQGNSFRISGGKSGLEVSWMVTGIRHDLYAETHRIPTEETRETASLSAERD
jgi:hypothetical protein